MQTRTRKCIYVYPAGPFVVWLSRRPEMSKLRKSVFEICHWTSSSPIHRIAADLPNSPSRREELERSCHLKNQAGPPPGFAAPLAPGRPLAIPPLVGPVDGAGQEARAAAVELHRPVCFGSRHFATAGQPHGLAAVSVEEGSRVPAAALVTISQCAAVQAAFRKSVSRSSFVISRACSILVFATTENITNPPLSRGTMKY
jgi:hypothetical protein